MANNKYVNLSFFLIGLFFLGVSGYVMSLFFPNLYFSCEKITNCHYIQINGTEDCFVELTVPHESYNYTCTKTPCPYNFATNQTLRTEICYLPPHEETCPYETCLNRDLLTAIWVSGFVTLGAVFFILFSAYHIVAFARKFKEDRRLSYNTF